MEMNRKALTVAALQKLNLRIDRDPQTTKEVPVHCPFHDDNTASMYINTEEGVFKCFSCHRSGSIEKLFKEITGVSLYTSLGVKFDEFSTYPWFSKPSEPPNYEVIGREISISMKGSIKPLMAAPPAIQYLRKRGLSLEVAKRMKCRFAESAYLNGTPFRNRLIIPIYEKENLVAVEGRDVLGTQKPKTLYPKGSSVNTLYDLDVLDQTKPLYVVEGLIDLMVLRESEFFINSTALFGASVTHRQYYLLNKFPSIIYIPDNDRAGINSVEQMDERLKTELWVLRVPKELNGIEMKDVNDLKMKGKMTMDFLIKRQWHRSAKKIH